MLDLLNIIPFISFGTLAGFLAWPPRHNAMRLSCRKNGGLWFWRVGRLGGSFYLAKR